MSLQEVQADVNRFLEDNQLVDVPLVLAAPPGRGKTALCAHLYSTLLVQYRRAIAQGDKYAQMVCLRHIDTCTWLA